MIRSLPDAHFRAPVRRVFLLTPLCLALTAAFFASYAQDLPSLPEYEIKAAFLLNFARFTEWPVPRASSDPLVFGIVGESPFDDAVLEKVAKARVNQRSLQFKTIQSISELGCCQLLFVSASEDRRVEGILRAAHANGILTVGESDAFARSGGMIRFFEQEGSVRFEVNLQSVEASSLKMSAKLLSVARVVRSASGMSPGSDAP